MTELFALMGTIAINNTEANNAIDETANRAERTHGRMKSAFGKVGSAAVTLGKGVAAAGTAIVGGLTAAAESTRDYRVDMGKLETAFTTSGFSAEAAQNSYRGLYAVMGETDTAVEAANHLAKLTTNEQELNTWTDICTGVFATFGDSLPLEGLTEAANETAKVGQVTGPLADALNWATLSAEDLGTAFGGNTDAMNAYSAAIAKGESQEDAFNAALAACTTEQERAALITGTLDTMYKDAADTYKELNGDIMDANLAQENLNNALANFGAVAEPVVAIVKNMAAKILSSFTELTKGLLEVIHGNLSFGDFMTQALTDLQNAVTTKLPELMKTGVNMLQSFIEGMSGNMSLLVSVAAQIITTFVQSIAESLPTLIPAAVGLLTSIVQAIVDNLPVLLEAGLQLVIGLAQGIINAIPELIAALPSIITAIVGFIVGATPQIVAAGVQLLISLVKNLPGIIAEIVKAVPQIIAAIVKGFVSGASQMIDAGRQLMGGLWNGINDKASALKDNIKNMLDGIKTIFTAAWDNIKNIVSTVLNAIKTVITTVFNAYKTVITTTMNGIKTVMTTVWNAIKTVVTTVINAIKNTITTVFNAVKSAITNTLNGIKSVFTNVWNGIKSAVSTVVGAIKSVISSGLNGASGVVSNVLGGIKDKFSNIFEGAKNIVKGAIDKIKGFFNFSWSLPKLKLPHFSISGSFSLNPPSVPRFGIDWYKKAMEDGMIMNEPTIFGYDPKSNKFLAGGEAGSETVVGTGNLMAMIKSAVASENNALAEKLDRLILTVEKYFPAVLKGLEKSIVLDSGALVGELAPAIDSELGVLAARRGR
ncbi:MAG: hypothetical protein HFE90_08930 [Firmicutes bacterium]|nr:hypothetical protein [Bacillota bacterium]